MGLIGINDRSYIDPEQQRRSYLKLVYENGYHDGYYAATALREQAYLKDDEALMRYRIGLRIGMREKRKVIA